MASTAARTTSIWTSWGSEDRLASAREALGRLSELVRPGGTLAVVGFARASWRDWPWAATALVVYQIVVRAHGA